MHTTTQTSAITQRNRVGARVELARYVVSAGERVLHGQRIDGVVRLTDVPAEGPGAPTSSTEASSKTATPPSRR